MEQLEAQQRKQDSSDSEGAKAEAAVVESAQLAAAAAAARKEEGHNYSRLTRPKKGKRKVFTPGSLGSNVQGSSQQREQRQSLEEALKGELFAAATKDAMTAGTASLDACVPCVCMDACVSRPAPVMCASCAHHCTQLVSSRVCCGWRGSC